MANTSPRHMPVLGNVHPIKIENFDIFFVTISLLARVFIFLIDGGGGGGTQDVGSGTMGWTNVGSGTIGVKQMWEVGLSL